jgi:ferrous iron transport protein B
VTTGQDVEPVAPAHEATSPTPSANALVVMVGNPNTGKSTLFNRLTGQNARVGNYPGVTVERRVGKLRLDSGAQVEVIDAPGAYSLSARSAEEQIALEAILGLHGNPKPALALVVVDAGQLARNLYLVLQLAELGVPMVIALNMIDEVGEDPPDPDAIRSVFDVPVVPISARRGQGIDRLSSALGEALARPPKPRVQLAYPEALRCDVDRVADALPPVWRSNVERDRALALWALVSIEADDELGDIPDSLRERCLDVHRAAEGRDIDQEIIETRYRFLDEHVPGFYREHDPHPKKRPGSERVDRVLLHPIFGFAIFVLVMLVMFQTLFSWADPAISLVEGGVSFLQRTTESLLPDGVVRDLISQGIIGGVGNVVVFLPQILLLFLFIGLLEDSGYMARVAYLMDRIMRTVGLHGRAFVPMLSGFACAVPAILATRTMERSRDRLLTMLVVPLMTCSARLPIYTLIIGALFPPMAVFGWIPVQGLLMAAMYVFSVLIALIAAGVLGRTVVRGRRIPLILELPPYRVPQPSGVLRMMWERSSVFLKEAGTVILVCTVVLWALLYFPRPAETSAPPAQATVAATTAPDQAAVEGAAKASALEQSFGGRLGHAIEPVLRPLGFDWKIGVGIIGAFAAREVFVSTMALVYGIGEVDDEAMPLRERIRSEARDGKPVYTPLVGLSLMIFFALACQCMSTLAVVRRETKSWRWPAFMFAYMTALAYVASLLVYQGGRLLGFS